MKYLAAIAASLSVAASAAYSEECKTIENDLDRLACYDKESGRTAIPEVTINEDAIWSVSTSKSEFKDTTDVILRVVSDNALGCSRYGETDSAVLIIRCSENSTAMYIVTGCHLTSGHGGYGKVEYRFDEKPAGSRNFNASTDNRALGLWSGSRSIGLVKQMFDADKALFRFTPFNENSVTARFTITGLEEAIKPLRKECGW